MGIMCSTIRCGSIHRSLNALTHYLGASCGGKGKLESNYRPCNGRKRMEDWWSLAQLYTKCPDATGWGTWDKGSDTKNLACHNNPPIFPYLIPVGRNDAWPYLLRNQISKVWQWARKIECPELYKQNTPLCFNPKPTEISHIQNEDIW